ncbi:hypothetical protein C0995_012661, partial [Termitomyces sp. Mi166
FKKVQGSATTPPLLLPLLPLPPLQILSKGCLPTYQKLCEADATAISSRVPSLLFKSHKTQLAKLSATTIAKPIGKNCWQELLATPVSKNVTKTDFKERNFSTLEVSSGTPTSDPTIPSHLANLL